jgi:hypothetical protein
LSSGSSHSYSLTAIRNSTGVAPTSASYVPRSASATTYTFGGSNISATNPTSTSIRVSGAIINNAAGASWNYRVRRLRSDGVGGFVTVKNYVTVTAGTTQFFDFVDSGLLSSTQYFYYLEAVNSTTGNIVQTFPSIGFVATGNTTLAPAPGAPTSVSASDDRNDGIDISWSGASGTITSYGIWYGPEPSDSSTPDFTISSTQTFGSYLDTDAPVGSRQYWVRSQGSANSPWVPSGGVTGTRLPPAPVFSDTTITSNWFVGQNYNTATDRTVAASDTTSYSIVASSPSINTFPSWLSINSSGQLSGTPTASGTYTFRISADGDGGTTASGNISITVQVALSWTDETLESPLRLNVQYSDAVLATNSPTYSIDGVAESPTNLYLFLPGIYLHKTNGSVSGTPTQQGTFTKVIRATNAGGAITKSFTLSVNPIGKRFIDISNSSPLTTLKRYDPAVTPDPWVFVNTAKRFNGTSWENIDNF